MPTAAPPPWLLLIHQLPPRPAYLRVKVRRRLERLGAIPLKNSVYALPNNESSLEDFEWLAREIESDGGEVFICSASMLRGGIEPGNGKRPTTRGRGASTVRPDKVPAGRTWITRRNVGVDRIASGWLIREFIDPAAKFKFVTEGYRPKTGELRFDMFRGEYGHEGTRCTFETLLARFGILDSRLRVIGELVHDLDCKDDRFGRAEAAGFGALIEGIVRTTTSDRERLQRGADLLRELYRGLARGARRRSR